MGSNGVDEHDERTVKVTKFERPALGAYTIEELEQHVVEREREIERLSSHVALAVAEIHVKRQNMLKEKLNTDDPIPIAKHKAVIDQRYSTAVSKRIHSLGVMDAEEFWAWVDGLRKDVQREKHPQLVIKRVLDHFCWKVLHGSQWSMPAWEKCATFVNKWREVRAKLHHDLFDMPGVEKGDDGYGDWVELLVMLGHDICLRLMAGEYPAYDDVRRAVYQQANEEGVKPARLEAYHDFIMNGEAHITHHLEESLKEYFTSAVRHTEED